ncbi:nucleotide-sugar transporter domain-containing protein [Ditylenchus destructor]|nr:nucleotide-sugar transporter domain-containing protein [Ditylenchus destructor]
MSDGDLVSDKQKLLPANSASLTEDDAYPKNGVQKSRTFTIPMGIEIRRDRPSGLHAGTIKIAVLIWLTLQNSIHTLLLRYSRVRVVPEMFFSTVAVFWTEVFKIVICLGMVANESNGIIGCLLMLKKQVLDQPWDTLKVCLPAMLYTLQNNLFYTAASHLDAATFMIVSQLKIFATALFSIILLNRTLIRPQWFSLAILFIGVSLVQLQEGKSTKKTAAEDAQSPVLGFTAACVACTISGFAGCFFEKILKGSAPVTIWMRNVQMSVFAIPASFAAAMIQDGSKIAEHGFLYGFDAVVWFTALWYCIGGLSVAICIKYADNIAKNFATSVAIILATIGSIHFFGFTPNIFFVVGALFVIFSVFLYSSSSIFLKCFGSCGSSR